ncbi:MAG: hypothetical protein ACTSO7_03335 [Candidatus Heimdallarchaeota archaeon]
MVKLSIKFNGIFTFFFIFQLVAIFVSSSYSIGASHTISGTWTNHFTVSTKDNLDDQRHTMILDNNDNLHVVWNEFNNDIWQLKHRQLFVATNSWSEIFDLSISAPDVRAQTPILTKDSQGIIHLTWWEVDYDQGISYQNYRYYSDNSWSSIITLTGFSFKSEYYDFVSLNNSVLLFIFGNEYNTSAYGIYYQTYNWVDQTYGSRQQLTNSTQPFQNPSIIVDSQHIAHVCWTDYANSTKKELLYQRFDGSWSPVEPFVISQIDNYQVSSSQMCIDSEDNVHFIYSEGNFTYSETHYRILSDDILGIDQTLEQYSTMFIDNADTIHFTFQKQSNESTTVIAYQQLLQNGSWSNILQYDTGISNGVEILHAIDSIGFLHVTWIAYDENDWVIYYIGCNLPNIIFSNAIVLPIVTIIISLIPVYFSKKLRKKKNKKDRIC